MNEQELRVGNWVLWGVNPVEVKGIHTDTYGMNDNRKCHIYAKVAALYNANYMAMGMDDINPIPLYHPILEKHRTAHLFVLENRRHLNIDENLLLRIVKQQFNRNVWIPALVCKDYEIKLPPVEHLHQLQNLVFALSGKELEINLSL